MMETMSVEVVDEVAQRYRNGQYGEFGMMPPVLAPGPPPPVVAFSTWTTGNDPRFTRRPVAGDTDYLDVDHEGTRWTYRLHTAYVAEPSSSGGFYQWPQPFEVGVLPD